MATATVTPGSVLALFQEEEPQMPVVQVINHKAVMNPTTGQERYRYAGGRRARYPRVARPNSLAFGWCRTLRTPGWSFPTASTP